MCLCEKQGRYSVLIMLPIFNCVSMHILWKKWDPLLLHMSIFCSNLYIWIALHSMLELVYRFLSSNDCTSNWFIITQLIPSQPVRCTDKTFAQSLFGLMFIKVVYVVNAQFHFTLSMACYHHRLRPLGCNYAHFIRSR